VEVCLHIEQARAQHPIAAYDFTSRVPPTQFARVHDARRHPLANDWDVSTLKDYIKKLPFQVGKKKREASC
jgi:hypothetical protein